jgi:hypothetical protein
MKDAMSRHDDVEEYSPERVAEFLLNNAVTAEDWDAAAADFANWDWIRIRSQMWIQMPERS